MNTSIILQNVKIKTVIKFLKVIQEYEAIDIYIKQILKNIQNIGEERYYQILTNTDIQDMIVSVYVFGSWVRLPINKINWWNIHNAYLYFINKRTFLENRNYKEKIDNYFNYIHI